MSRSEDLKEAIRSIQMIQKMVHQNSRNKGFWEGEANQNIPTKLMLIVSELAEAMEADRAPSTLVSDKLASLVEKDGGSYRLGIDQTVFAEEMADAVIRIMDLCEWVGINLGNVIIDKAKYNESRSHRHGGKKY